MKIVVTGGLGFIGSYIVKNLVKKKHKVLNIDKISYCSQRNLKIKNNNYRFIKSDISKYSIEKIILKFNPDMIINCAAETHVDRSIDNPRQFIESNIIGTFNLLNAAIKIQLKKKIRFVQISTDEVFGSLKINKNKFNEKTPYNPKSPYSAAKASSDHLVRSYGNTFNLDYIITNCSNNYGPYQYPEKLIPVVINCCINKRSIPIYGNGKNIRDWIYVEDHANGVITAALKGGSKQTYLIGSNNELNNLDIVKKICKIFNQKNKGFNYLDLISFVEDRKGHDLRYAINFNKIKKDLKWKPKKPFEKGLMETVNFYTNNYSKMDRIFNIDKWLKKKLKN